MSTSNGHVEPPEGFWMTIDGEYVTLDDLTARENDAVREKVREKLGPITVTWSATGEPVTRPAEFHDLVNDADVMPAVAWQIARRTDKDADYEAFLDVPIKTWNELVPTKAASKAKAAS